MSQNVIQKNMCVFLKEFGHGKQTDIADSDMAQEATIDDMAMKTSRMHAACVTALQQAVAVQKHKCKLQLKPSVDVQADHAMKVGEMLVGAIGHVKSDLSHQTR